MAVYPIKANFSRGELTPKLHARVDLEYYAAALESCINWLVMKQGGLRRRPGFRYVARVRNHAKRVRLLPFVFSQAESYMLEIGDGYIRKHVSGPVTVDVGVPTSITNANPGVVTIAGHGLSTGQRVLAMNIGGMVEINNRELAVTVIDPDRFSIGVDTSAFGAFTSGGTIRRIVETSSPWTEADLRGLSYAHSADIMTICHAGHRPRELSRLSETSWTLADAEFRDGPYMDEVTGNTNGVTPSATNSIVPMMTANNAPAGVVANSDGDTDAWLAFDGDHATSSVVDDSKGWWEYTPAAPAVCNSYWIKCHGENTHRAPASWVFQGWDGSGWVDLDTRSNETSWGGGEVRYFDFINSAAFSKYRISIDGTSGGAGKIQISEMGWGYNGDYGPTITFAFDNTDNINGGAGFNANDVGRPLRLRGGDGRWRWVKITSVVSTTEVQGRMYGYSLPNLNKIFRWQLGSWREGQWPSLVSFFEARRVFAASAAEPNVIWMTKAFDYYDFGVSDPMVDDDGLRYRIMSSQINAITFLGELDRLAIGTSQAVRVMGRANANAGFGATNFDVRPNSFTPSSSVAPVRIGEALLFAGYHGRTLHELVYDLNTDGYISPDVSLLSDHLLHGVIAEMAYQATPDSIVWIRMESGDLVTLTYERQQKVVGFARVEIAEADPGTGAYVESVACKPGNGRDEVWIAVRRTVGGQTRRTIETLAPEFEGMAVEDGVFLDCAMSRAGSPATELNGLQPLAGLTVDALLDGIVERGLTVSATGRLTLPRPASKVHVGLPFRSTATTLPMDMHGQQDGSGLGRRKLLQSASVSVMDSLGLMVKGVTSGKAFPVFRRTNDDPAGQQMRLRTGLYSLNFDASYRDDGRMTFHVDDPLPCMVRGFIFGVNGEP